MPANWVPTPKPSEEPPLASRKEIWRWRSCACRNIQNISARTCSDCSNNRRICKSCELLYEYGEYVANIHDTSALWREKIVYRWADNQFRTWDETDRTESYSRLAAGTFLY